jgi:hypothetical protein
MLATLVAAAISMWAAAWVHAHGFTLYWGDAEAHLNNARRIVEARTTGYEEIGSPWLPLPHFLMLPLVIRDSMWRSGLAGVIPSTVCFTAAAVLFFASVRRGFGAAQAWAAMLLFVLNPNALYLQSIPMTEAVFFATLMGILFFSMRYRDSQSWGDLTGMALACNAASMTRYEGWILIPFTALFVLLESRQRWRGVLLGVVASASAAWWFVYNWQLSGNPLNFYNGPDSAMAIQRGEPYPGHGDWLVAIQYFFATAKLVTGWPLVWIGAIGACVALWKRASWPIGFLALWPLFIVWSMHSSAQPIHVPTLWPFSWYNTRYALSMLPFLAAGAGALACRRVLVPVVVLAGAGFWIVHLDHENWICWKESEQNSIERRRWTREAAEFLKTHAKPADTYFSTFGDISGIFREAGIRFRQTLTWDDFPEWHLAERRPDQFLWEDWIVAQCGDRADDVVKRARVFGVHYDLITEISVPKATSIEIYRRHEYSLR